MQDPNEQTSDATATPATHDGVTVWFTGLSGSGKTTLCNAVLSALAARGLRIHFLDSDVLRQHISRDLGFTRQDREENVRRIGSIAEPLTKNRFIVLVAAISPYRDLRAEMRARIERFLEVFVHAPLEVCERRDPKGLYRRARCGQLTGFTGVDDPYEEPLMPDLRCDTDRESVEACTHKVIHLICDYLGISAAV